MASVLLAPAFDELIDYLIERATPDEIMAFELSEVAQDRAAELVDRNNAGTLTPLEQIELEQMMHFEQRIMLLKAQAAGALKRQS
ncbi:MAG: hypothetical protein SF123_16065 [Chloroflexota bacterium]|nr:hypothetical protein [Chloroflexota bacterium]